ncbi:hypothetical protein AURDEDRAFT_174049 [Auricularia subglabra TFB-10046 SS5]|nr:hypothetical protein AURDEDRAFT_174049 [Auricularia subglabra TFB-10046 SS5]
MLLVRSITRGHSCLVTGAIGSPSRQLSSAKATHNLKKPGHLKPQMQLKARHRPQYGLFPRANDALSSGLGFYSYRGLAGLTTMLVVFANVSPDRELPGSARCLFPASNILVYNGTVPVHAPETFVSRPRRTPSPPFYVSLRRGARMVCTRGRRPRLFDEALRGTTSHLHRLACCAPMDPVAQLANGVPPKIPVAANACKIVLAAPRVWRLSRWRSYSSRIAQMSFVCLSTGTAAPTIFAAHNAHASPFYESSPAMDSKLFLLSTSSAPSSRTTAEDPQARHGLDYQSLRRLRILLSHSPGRHHRAAGTRDTAAVWSWPRGLDAAVMTCVQILPSFVQFSTRSRGRAPTTLRPAPTAESNVARTDILQVTGGVVEAVSIISKLRLGCVLDHTHVRRPASESSQANEMHIARSHREFDMEHQDIVRETLPTMQGAASSPMGNRAWRVACAWRREKCA